MGDLDPEVQAMEAVRAALASLSEEERLRVVEWISKRYGLGLLRPGGQASRVAPILGNVDLLPASGFVRSMLPSPKEFVVEKQPQNESERVAVLAFYLTRYRDTHEFNTKDITELNREAKQPPISKPTRAVNNATLQSQYLVPASKGKKQLSTRGEALVEAMPDRERVREALAEHGIVGRRRKSGKSGGQKKG